MKAECLDHFGGNLSLSDKAIIAAVDTGYTANPQGQVFKPNGEEVIGSPLSHSGHLRITMYVTGLNTRGHISVLKHRFIAYYFLGPEVFNHRLVRHINDTPQDNRITNLKPGSPKENRADIPKSVLSANAKKHAHKFIEQSRKLTDQQILEMRKERHDTGASYAVMAKRYKIATMTAYRAISKQSWVNI